MRARSIVASVALLVFGTAIAQDEGVSWQDLSDGQREVLSQLEAGCDDLPPGRQQRLALGAERRTLCTRTSDPEH